ncbi:MAG: cyclic pyranopterin monophosphate synthase MoaC [Candidatus Bathyarchaeota archaeon]|nr:MAG: cyclic pyranopterin monophosphate synthase MoaC [Candidatus Bathyarchaeota archaeon]
MIDVSDKPEIRREATAQGSIRLKPETIRLIREKKIEKGDVFSLAKVSGVLAAKKTSELIPLCHPLPLTSIDISIQIHDKSNIAVEATVKASAKTGVEMEALVAVSTALLTIWDMTKQYEKDRQGQYPTTVISGIRVLQKVKSE